jgi:hypothetical protein
MRTNSNKEIPIGNFTDQKITFPIGSNTHQRTSKILFWICLIDILLAIFTNISMYILFYRNPGIPLWGTGPFPLALLPFQFLKQTSFITALLFLPAFFYLIYLSFRKSVFSGIFSIFLFVLSLPPLCFISVVISRVWPEEIISTIKRDGNTYYLTYDSEDFGVYSFYECNVQKMDCKLLYYEIDPPYNLKSKLVIDEDSNKIFAYRKSFWYTQLLFSYDSQLRHFQKDWVREWHDEKFALYHYQNRIGRTFFVLTNCIEVENEAVIGTCSFMPFGYYTERETDGLLTVEDKLDELQIIINNRLVFTFDGQPHCLVRECQVAPIE